MQPLHIMRQLTPRWLLRKITVILTTRWDHTTLETRSSNCKYSPTYKRPVQCVCDREKLKFRADSSILCKVRMRKSAKLQFLLSLHFLKQNWEKLLPHRFIAQCTRFTAHARNTGECWSSEGTLSILGCPKVSTGTAGMSRQGHKKESPAACDSSGSNSCDVHALCSQTPS